MKLFYNVLYNGNILRYDLAKEYLHSKWYYFTSIIEDNEADEWILIDNAPTSKLGMKELSDTYISNEIKNGRFFLNLEDAIVKSKRLWEQYFAPNAMWQVVEIFDDVEVTPKSKPMPKIEAKQELKKYKNRPYVSYEIRKVKGD